MSDHIVSRIEDTIASDAIVLFMKGTPAAPQCGFSRAVAQILSKLGVSYSSVDVLADPEIRNGIKDFSSWPTIPQLYIKGAFIGGCDIVREMAESGELVSLLKENGIAVVEV